MIVEKQDISDAFSILHDGTIESYEQQHNSILLKISCIYLAELIHSSFQYFWIELKDVYSISLQPWLKDSQKIFFWTDLKLIFQKDLEILNANITAEETVKVVCECMDIFEGEEISYVGGTLEFDCHSICVFDESEREVSLDTLKKTATQYWGNFTNQ